MCNVVFVSIRASGTGSTDVDGQTATGLKEPTAEQAEWMKKNFRVVKIIHLNSLALERINQEREAKGLRKLSENEVDIAPIEEELEFAEASASVGGTMSAADGILPKGVDNSLSSAFPPIRSQGGVGSCVAWATTYYQFTYENNLARGRVASNGDNSMIFSPKWTYNMINGGADGGAYFSDAYALLIKHGAVTWAVFPYDSNYLQWCLNTGAWRSALNFRPLSWGQISNPDVSQLIVDLKTQLANGHVIVIGTYVNSWVQSYVKDDPSTLEDNAFVGQKIASYMRNTYQGGHGMTLVGYNNDIWCDLNGNGVVDAGEKGAFKIANSWGTGDWNNGYRWVTYDSLWASSTVPPTAAWPTSDRASSGIFRGDDMYTVTVRSSYQPKAVAEFTVNHLKRGQLRITLGIGGITTTSPTSEWYPRALYYSGGGYAFDGTTTACDGTFVFDFSELAPSTSVDKRWFVGMYDSTAGDAATIKTYKLYEVRDTGDFLVGTCTNVPKNVDAGHIYVWIDHKYNSTNISPTAKATATPTSGSIPLTVSFDGTGSSDPDGWIVSYTWNFGDGSTGSGQTVSHTYTTAGTYTATLTVTDNAGATGTDSVVISATDPNKINAPTNLKASVPRTSNTVTLQWTDNSNNEEGFYVERAMKKKSGYTAYQRVGTVGPNVTTFVETVSPGTYKYRVQAFNSETNRFSDYSNEVSVKVK